MNYSLLRAEQELYSKQPVREKPALTPSENDLIDGVVPLHLADASESEIEELLEERDQQEYIDALNDRCWGEDA